MPDTDKPLDTLSVAPDPGGSNQERDPRQDAGQDPLLARRLQRDPENPQAQLDVGLDESMDASDTPANVQPSTVGGEPAPSSGFDEEAERRLQQQR